MTCPNWTLYDLAGIIAVRWTSLGRASMNEAALYRVLADYWCVSVEAAAERFKHDEAIYRRGGDVDTLSDAIGLLDTHALLLPMTSKLRFNHSFALDNTKSAETTLDAILAEGLVPQPTGRGKHSEAPHLVFGVGDYPPGKHVSGRQYSNYAPWITAEVDRQNTDCEGYNSINIGQDAGPGSVVALWRVRPESIIAVNGYPVREFVRLRRLLG